MNYNMTIQELETLLASPEYKQKQYDIHTHPHFERLNEYGGIATLFDDMCDQLGRLPSQSEYIAAGLLRAESYFSPRKGKKPDVTKYWGKNDMYSATFNWNDLELQKAVKKRLSRSYPSYLAEYTTIIQLKQLYPTFQIGSNGYLDRTAGVDIVVASPYSDRLVYIHVTSSSQQSKDTLNEKKTRWGMAKDKNGKKHWFERNFNKGHIHLAFSKFDETDSTRIINGNPIFKPEHLQMVIDSAMSVPDPNNRMFDTWWFKDDTKIEGHQLCELHHFLLINKIDSNGIGDIWV